jgi:thioesterase domain-containing protein/acyl carrier protein
MVAIWRDVLELPSVELDSSFFDLGGTSMQAARVFGRITETFGVALGLAALLQAPTPAELAEFLVAELEAGGGGAGGESLEAGTERDRPALARPDRAATWSNLVPVQPTGSRRPFFCVHGRGGNVLTFARLARHLDDRPFWGLQAEGLAPGTVPDPTIEVMAARYCRAIRAVQPVGPYLLGGFSGGGVVALEMARRLRSTGDGLDLVVLLDTFCPLVNDRPRAEQLKTLGQNLRRRGLSYSASYAGDMVRSRLEARRSASDGAGDPIGAVGAVDLTEAFLAALDRYQVVRYEAPVVLLKAQRLGATFPPDNGWAPWIAGSFEVIESPGDHNSMFDDANVGTLAGHLAHALDRAERPSL